jgi:hypothetical protein
VARLGGGFRVRLNLIEVLPSPVVHPDLASLAALAVTYEDRSPVRMTAMISSILGGSAG